MATQPSDIILSECFHEMKFHSRPFAARAAGVPCRRTNPEPQQRAAGTAVGNTKLWNSSIWGIFQPWKLRLRNKLYLGMIGRPGLSLYILGVGWQNAQKVQKRPTVHIRYAVSSECLVYAWKRNLSEVHVFVDIYLVLLRLKSMDWLNFLFQCVGQRKAVTWCNQNV